MKEEKLKKKRKKNRLWRSLKITKGKKISTWHFSFFFRIIFNFFPLSFTFHQYSFPCVFFLCLWFVWKFPSNFPSLFHIHSLHILPSSFPQICKDSLLSFTGKPPFHHLRKFISFVPYFHFLCNWQPLAIACYFGFLTFL